MNKRSCEEYAYANSIVLSDATSLDMCASACENQGAGAIGCCEWQHDWASIDTIGCRWYAEQRRTQPVLADDNRSAVLCSSKYNEVVVYNFTNCITMHDPIINLRFQFVL